MKRIDTKRLSFCSLFTALIVIFTMFVRVPLPMLGYVHLGDGFIFLAVFILGPVYGSIASGLGSMLADLFGYPLYAPATLIIKALTALCAYLVYAFFKKLTKKSLPAEIIAGVVGSVVMALGYFLYEMLFLTTFAVAIVNVPWNLLQGAVGILVAVVMMRAMKVTKLLDILQKK